MEKLLELKADIEKDLTELNKKIVLAAKQGLNIGIRIDDDNSLICRIIYLSYSQKI